MYVGSLELLSLFHGRILKKLVDTATLACICHRGRSPYDRCGQLDLLQL